MSSVVVCLFRLYCSLDLRLLLEGVFVLYGICCMRLRLSQEYCVHLQLDDGLDSSIELTILMVKYANHCVGPWKSVCI